MDVSTQCMKITHYNFAHLPSKVMLEEASKTQFWLIWDEALDQTKPAIQDMDQPLQKGT